MPSIEKIGCITCHDEGCPKCRPGMSRRKFFMFGALLAAASAEIVVPSTWPVADLTGDSWLYGVHGGLYVPLSDRMYQNHRATCPLLTNRPRSTYNSW